MKRFTHGSGFDPSEAALTDFCYARLSAASAVNLPQANESWTWAENLNLEQINSSVSRRTGSNGGKEFDYRVSIRALSLSLPRAAVKSFGQTNLGI